MSEKRFAIKPQDDYWAVVDNYNEDKVCIINGIHTEIEAIWLCDFMNEQQNTIQELERKLKKYAKIGEEQLKQITDLQDELNECRARPTDERGVVKVEYR